MNDWQTKYHEYLMLCIQKDNFEPLTFESWKRQFEDPSELICKEANDRTATKEHEAEQASKRAMEDAWRELLKQQEQRVYINKTCPHCPRPAPMFYPGLFDLTHFWRAR